MGTKRFMQSIAAVVLLALVVSAPALAGTYRLVVNGEQLEFVAQPERGYVLKLAEWTGNITALSSITVLDAEDARPVRGLGRCGVWIVENSGLVDHNQNSIRSLSACGQVAYAAPLFSSNGETVAIIPEVVVRVESSTEIEQVEAICKAAGCTIRKRMEFTTQEYLVEILGADAEAVFTAVEILSHCPAVEWACPNTAFRPNLCSSVMAGGRASGRPMRITAAVDDPNACGVFPNDEYFPMQWHLHNTGQSGGTPGADICASEAWEITTGDPNIVVAVIDCGVDTNHPDLINNLVPGYDFIQDDNSPYPPVTDDPAYAHGTACAGLVAAEGNNEIGVTGVAWNCKIMPISVEFWNPTAEADIAESIRWAAAHGADILSNSWCSGENPTPIIHSAIVDITKHDGLGRGGKGCIVFFAAGNESENLLYPPKYSEVIAVGATDHNDLRWWYSNHGPELDVMAPSGCADPECSFYVDLWSTDISESPGHSSDPYYTLGLSDYAAIDGTSAACPIAASVAALILSIEPELTNKEVRHFLGRSAKDLGDPGRDNYYGWGRVDARAALDMVLAKRADLNNDWRVDEADEAIMLLALDSNDLSADIAPAKKRDGTVDDQDLELMMQYWQVAIPEMGLIAHWALDETAGMFAADSVGDHDGIVLGAPVWQPAGGQVGGALKFDGVDDCLIVSFPLDGVDEPFSLLAWVQGGAPGQVIVSQEGAWNWLLANPLEGNLMTELQGSGRSAGPLWSQITITDGAWHRVGLVWDGVNRRLYVDDVEVATDTQAGLIASDGNLRIGCGADQSPNTFFSGLIDDVRIYNRAVKP